MKLVAKIKRRLFPPPTILDGYEQPELIDVIFRKTLAYVPQGDWPEMHGVSSVLDFGGGAGLHYKEANLPNARWAVVETKAMVDRAMEIATDSLHFFPSVKEAVDWLGSVDLMYSDGAIQYTPDPMQVVRELCSVGAQKLIWRRVFFSKTPRVEIQSSYLGDNGPGTIDVAEKTVRYKRVSISESDFMAAHNSYSLDDRGDDWFRFQITRTI